MTVPTTRVLGRAGTITALVVGAALATAMALPASAAEAMALRTLERAARAAHVLTGTVTDAEGESLAGITVTAHLGARAVTATTDRDGGYRVRIADGVYRIEFDGVGWASQWFSGARTEEDAKPLDVYGDVAEVNARMAPASGISGTIRMPDRDRERGTIVAVVAYEVTTDGFVERARTEARDGEYSLTDLDAGDYVVRAVPQESATLAPVYFPDALTTADAKTVRVESDRPTSGIDIALAEGLRAGGRLDAGDGVDRGTPVTVTVRQVGVDDPMVRTVAAEADGTYEVQALVPGSYTVIASGEGVGAASGDAATFALARPIELTTDGFRGGDLELQRSAVIAGSIQARGASDDATASVTAYVRLDGAWVAALSTSGWSSWTLGGRDTWLRTGEYVVGVADAGDPSTADDWAFCPQFTHGVATLDEATPIKAVAGERSDIDFRLGSLGDDCDAPSVEPGHVGISGGRVVGGVLTAVGAKWGPPPVTFAYQWVVGGKPIDGATGRSLTVTPELAGQSITVRVVGSKPGFRRVSVVSEPVLVGEEAMISGTVRGAVADDVRVTAVDEQGRALTSTTVALRDGEGTYELAVASDVRFTVRFDAGDVSQWWRATGYAQKAEYLTLARDEQLRGIDAELFGLSIEAGDPHIDGEPVDGGTLTVDRGDWPGVGEFLLQWLADGQPIDGATREAYSPTADVIGQTISVVVTGVLEDAVSAHRTSASTTGVAARPDEDEPVVAPAEPTVLVDPTGPSAPSDPSDPSDPVTPAEPAATPDPSTPAEPSTPTPLEPSSPAPVDPSPAGAPNTSTPQAPADPSPEPSSDSAPDANPDQSAVPSSPAVDEPVAVAAPAGDAPDAVDSAADAPTPTPSSGSPEPSTPSSGSPETTPPADEPSAEGAAPVASVPQSPAPPIGPVAPGWPFSAEIPVLVSRTEQSIPVTAEDERGTAADRPRPAVLGEEPVAMSVASAAVDDGPPLDAIVATTAIGVLGMLVVAVPLIDAFGRRRPGRGRPRR